MPLTRRVCVETVACSLSCAFFYPGALGLFVKTDDSRSGSGGPCSEPVGEFMDPEASHIPQKGSEKQDWAVGHWRQQTSPVYFWCSAAFPRSCFNSRMRFAI